MRPHWPFAVSVAMAWFATQCPAHSALQETPNPEAAEPPPALIQSDVPAPDDAVPQRQSFLLWFVSALDWRYTLMLPAATFLSFVLICLVIIYGRGWPAGSAAVLLVPLPLLVGLLGTMDGLMGSYLAIASVDVTLKQSEVAHRISTALASSLAGMCLMIPNYWLAVLGLLVRSMRKESGNS